LGPCTQAAGDAAEELFFLPSGIELLHTDLGCFHNELPGGPGNKETAMGASAKATSLILLTNVGRFTNFV